MPKRPPSRKSPKRPAKKAGSTQERALKEKEEAPRPRTSNRFPPGTKLVHRSQPTWGIGHVAGTEGDPPRLVVFFSGRPDEPVLVAPKDPALARYTFHSGESALLADGREALVVGPLPAADGEVVYEVEIDGEAFEAPEEALRGLPPRPGALESLASGRFEALEAYDLRHRVVGLDLLRRCDALGALFSSRVLIKPHQIAVAQRVLSARAPRFILADEVGLGKTIEAGMILAALHHAGLARRVLVISPAHLTLQWLAELFHKFNLLFTFLEGERLAEARKEKDGSPWQHFHRVVTSIELLARSEQDRAEAADPAAPWDLVIIDEAHHLKGEKAYAAAQALAKNSFGLLLLTATPMQLDPGEYFGLLKLVDAAPPESEEAFRRRMSRQTEVSAAARALMEGTKEEAGRAASTLAMLFAKDPEIRKIAEQVRGEAGNRARQSLLQRLAEVYSLSSRLIRNRRATVGRFTERRLHLLPVALSEEERALETEVQRALKKASDEGTLPTGAILASLLKRMGSSPPALARALAAREEPSLAKLADRAAALASAEKDSKLRAFRAQLERLFAQNRDEKVLVFAEPRETVEYLQGELSRAGIESLAYHGELSSVERDRRVARFRDPEGPRVLLSTELGGEGRNFQFCHHLIHYDLPFSPAAIEQRIGRIDRIGQRFPVEIYALRPEGTLAARVIDLMSGSVRVFEETVGGLDPVLEEVEGELCRLGLLGPDEAAWEGYARDLGERVTKARQRVTEAYDPLLDRRSFDPDLVGALFARGLQRAGLRLEEGGGLEEGLDLLSRDLDERMEECVTELAEAIGIIVDTEEQVEAFQCAFHLGAELNVDALPGIDITQERSILGTFWRDTAVDQEENEYFATGHPLVEALFGFVRDGELGRSSFVAFPARPENKLALKLSYIAVPPEPEDLAAGARVPSRHVGRYLDTERFEVAVELRRDGPKLNPDLLRLDPRRGRPVSAREVVGPGLAEGIQAAAEAGLAEANGLLGKAVEEALRRLGEDRRIALERLSLALAARADEASESEARAEIASEERFFQQVEEALRGVTLELDQALGMVLGMPRAGR